MDDNVNKFLLGMREKVNDNLSVYQIRINSIDKLGDIQEKMFDAEKLLSSNDKIPDAIRVLEKASLLQQKLLSNLRDQIPLNHSESPIMIYNVKNVEKEIVSYKRLLSKLNELEQYEKSAGDAPNAAIRDEISQRYRQLVSDTNLAMKMANPLCVQLANTIYHRAQNNANNAAVKFERLAQAELAQAQSQLRNVGVEPRPLPVADVVAVSPAKGHAKTTATSPHRHKREHHAEHKHPVSGLGGENKILHEAAMKSENSPSPLTGFRVRVLQTEPKRLPKPLYKHTQKVEPGLELKSKASHKLSKENSPPKKRSRQNKQTQESEQAGITMKRK